ncbi:MAG: Mur ligase family protein, partial [Thermodesulfobacteriota bacterium]
MDLKGKNVLVVGMAQTGVATAKFLKAKGSMVTTTEVKPEEEMEEAVQKLRELGLSTEWGGHQIETFLKQDLIVVSPGVDLKIEPIQRAMGKGIPVISEIELAYQFIDLPIIAVTGTNGKTTTTLLMGEMFKEDGRKVGVGGNVGDPLILFTDGRDRWEILVAEISSFQLEAIQTFRPWISVLLNITEDH